jgi:hypothetical protein
MMATETPNSKFIHLYAIVRVDLPVNQDHPTNCIAVVKVFSSKKSAEQEASRLNKINEGKKCHYGVYISRFVA